MSYLTMDAITILTELESTLWKHFKKYISDNQEFFTTAAITMSGNQYAYSRMLNR